MWYIATHSCIRSNINLQLCPSKQQMANIYNYFIRMQGKQTHEGNVYVGRKLKRSNTESIPYLSARNRYYTQLITNNAGIL